MEMRASMLSGKNMPVERFFGVGSGVEIVSKPGEGTCVTLRLVGARRRLTRAGWRRKE